MNSEYSIVVSDVHKRYNTSTSVLNGVYMNVPKGSMYGLLGASGCGKTTLLKCTLGKLTIDSGTIKLSVDKHRNVGFMPQSVSLHSDLKVKELFIFYGLLLGVYGNELSSRFAELTDLLELPPSNKTIANCSGGQQRRISLGVTLLHNPDLLILDEPTVGLDPLLSHKIWVYLKSLCLTQRKTVVVTTHYMEEARSLHLVGLMRGGVILAEKSPSSLLNEYNCSSLDDVFLALSQKQEFNKSVLTSSCYPPIQVKEQPCLRREKSFNLNHLKAQIYKNYKWTLRNIPVTLFILFLPVFTACMTAIIFKELKTDLKIGYYSEELFNASCEVNSTVPASGCLPSPPFSCHYIEILQLSHPTERFDSVEEGLNAIRKGRTFVLIHFPYNFTNTVVKRMSFKTPRKSEVYNESTVYVWTDNTNYGVIFHAKFDMYSALQKLIERKCVECGINTALAKTPMAMQNLIYGQHTTLCSKIYPHFLNGFLFYTTFMYTSASLLAEKSSGVLERVQMNGMTTSEILIANFTVQFIVLTIQNGLTLFAIYGIFKEGYLGSMILMYCILLLNEFFGSLVGLLLLTFTESTVLVNYIGVGAILTILLTNGMMWPSEGIHRTLKPLVQLLPTNMASVSYSHVMLHGFGLNHSSVYSGVLYVFAWSLALIMLVYVRIRVNNNQM